MQSSLHERRLKQIEEGLDVHVWTSGGFLRAGTMQLGEEGDRQMNASFAYDPDYLVHPLAYPLDPLNLPLQEGAWETSSHLVTLGAIFDAAPDAWGRRVVRASLPQISEVSVYREAFLRGADGIGAVLLTPSSARPADGSRQDIDELVAWSRRERPALSQLQEAANAARLLEQGADLDASTRALLAGSWTIGGARPKSIMRDDRIGAAPARSVVVKFESRDGGGWRNRIEWVTLEIARLMGLPVPAHALVPAGDEQGTAALVLDRFDRTDPDGDRPACRLHYVSAASLVSAEPTSRHMDSARDRAYFSWKRLLEVTGAVSARPSYAKAEMFARLALNAALHNTDDHLKNFGFLKLHDHPVHYEIAPVFDISPQPATGHYLWCGSAGRVYTLAQALDCAREVGVTKKVAEHVRERLMSALDKRAELYEQAGMSARQVQIAESWIDQGLGTASSRPLPPGLPAPRENDDEQEADEGDVPGVPDRERSG